MHALGGGHRRLCNSALLRGQDHGDFEMGARAAAKTNKMLDRISDMYVGKNTGYSRKYSESYERVFGKRGGGAEKLEGPRAPESVVDVKFGSGPLGMEIEWSVPPVVTGIVPKGAAEAAGVQMGQIIVRINGRDATVPMPELELDDLMHQRPLCLRLSERSAMEEAAQGGVVSPDPADYVRRLGVVKIAEALSRQASEELLKFVHLERDRCILEIQDDPSLVTDRFSDVQMPRAPVEGSPRTRWDMRLPLSPVVQDIVKELLRGGKGSLGAAFESLAGGLDAELWELGVVVSEPGAAPQPVHFDAPGRCLFTAFVALQDVVPEMGPTHFLLGTNAEVVHKRFMQDPAAFLDGAKATPALLNSGDAALYDSMILHCGGANQSDKTRALLYITFRDPVIDARSLGIDQHSIRRDLAGRFRLGHFRP